MQRSGTRNPSNLRASPSTNRAKRRGNKSFAGCLPAPHMAFLPFLGNVQNLLWREILLCGAYYGRSHGIRERTAKENKFVVSNRIMAAGIRFERRFAGTPVVTTPRSGVDDLG
jgi:hypothetical protein